MTVFTNEDKALHKVVEAFKNVMVGLSLEGIQVGLSVYPATEEDEDENAER